MTDAYTDLEKDEVQIVTGALVLKKKTVKDVMTKLDDCYMLPINTLLNFETVSEIKDQGYSRKVFLTFRFYVRIRFSIIYTPLFLYSFIIM